MKRSFLALALAACGSDDAPPMLDTPEIARCTPSPGPAAEIVMTTSGTLRGARDGETFAYKRVPFAAPPIGDARFTPPRPVVCPDTEVDATTLGPACPQVDAAGVLSGDEDCLHLNVWAPATAAAPRPVMLWIHGGGNNKGSGTLPFYDGRRLAEAGDVIVVTTNYRLGQLGYLGHASFGEGSGVFGLLDQIAALQWVRDNIAAVGGDPGTVTIFGESAGARNTCSLVASPKAAGLFHRAIMQSGSCKALPSRAVSEQLGADVAAVAGCDGAPDVTACMRALPVETVVRALDTEESVLKSGPFQPMIDGVVVTDQPARVIAAGAHNAVPFLVGANSDETAGSIPMVPSEMAYESLVRAQFPPAIADMVLAQYPASRFPSPRIAYARVTGDSRFLCPSREIAKAADAGQTTNVYRYFFQYATSPLGAVHGLDVPFVFGTFGAIETPNGPYVPDATDLEVSAAMMGYWTQFARAGEPGGTPAWPLYGAGDPTLVIDDAISTTNGIRTDDCDFWEPFYNAP